MHNGLSPCVAINSAGAENTKKTVNLIVRGGCSFEGYPFGVGSNASLASYFIGFSFRPIGTCK